MNSYSSSPLANIPPVVKNLLIINMLVWVADMVLPRVMGGIIPNFQLSDYLGLHYWSAERFNVLQMITYMFMHAGFDHIFFNMFAVFMFGSVLERSLGGKRFLFFYLVTGVGAAIIQELMWTIDYAPVMSALNSTIESNSGVPLEAVEGKLRKMLKFGSLADVDAPAAMYMKQLIANAPVTVGASGAVFGLLFAFGWLFPDAKLMLIFFPVPIRARIFVILYAAAELFLGVANFSFDNVAHFAHLGGMLFAWIIIYYWKKKGKLYL